MEQRVTTYSEYAMSTAVSGIKDIEAQTLDGISVQKIYFQPDVSIDLAIAQIINATNYIRLLMPPGIQSPLVVEYNASSVPVLQISLTSDKPGGSNCDPPSRLNASAGCSARTL
jgi:multidrug efflux pump subunit AcrB